MMPVHTWAFYFQCGWLKIFNRAQTDFRILCKICWCIATVALPWRSVSGVGFLHSFHNSKKNYKNLQVLRGIKVRENFQKQYFGKIFITMFFLLLEHHKNKEELSAVCN